MKSLGVIALAIAIAGAAATWAPYNVDPECTFDVQDACNKCPWDLSWLQFVTDGCDCRKYYSCEKNEEGVISWKQHSCDPCMCFSNKDWTCSIKIADGPQCPTNPPPIIQPIPTKDAYTSCFCADFDGDARENTYYVVDPTCLNVWISPSAYIDQHWAWGRGIESHGTPCHIDIPYFSNNQFRTFALCGMFNYFSTYPATRMGLAYDGWDDTCAPGSIQIYKDTDNHVYGGIRTEQNKWFFVKSYNVAAASTWHKVCLIYNGNGNAKTLSITLDYTTHTITQPGLVGLTAKPHCNMHIGQGKDFSGNKYGFYGLLDTWCFSPNLLRTNQCATYGPEPHIQVE